MSDSWRVGESVNILEVFLGDLERTSSDVGNVLFDQLAGINCGLVDLLEQEATEGLDTRAQECAVEGHVDAFQWDGCEATLQRDGPGLGLGLLDTLLDDAHQVGLDIFQRHALHQCRDVDVLGLEEIEQVGEAVEGTKLERHHD